MDRKRLENDLFPNSSVELPDETVGICERCKEFTLLGNGFCSKCWDRGGGRSKVYFGVGKGKEEDCIDTLK